MNGMKHVLLDFFDRPVFDEVLADAPVLLRRVEDLVVDPAAVRRLQQWMVEEEEEAAAVDQHASDFGERAVDVVDVLEDEASHHRVERPPTRTAGRRRPPRA